MKGRRGDIEQTYQRYQRSDKKEKPRILDEFTAVTRYNRDYGAHLLSNWGKAKLVVDGKLVTFGAGEGGRKKRPARKGGGRPRVYHDRFVNVLTAIWELHDDMCGKLLAPLLRLAIEFLVAAGRKELPDISDEVKGLLVRASPSTIDRYLRKAQKHLRVTGKSLTKPRPLLKNQIPVRVSYSGDEWKMGFLNLIR